MNTADMGLAFIEGVGLILSPCILPVLPLVLATSINGGRSRPFGVILGFIFSFAVFVFLSRKLVTALGINLDIIKYGSLVLLAAFGLVLLSETLSQKFSAATQRFANLGNSLSAQTQGGFWGGIGIGALIGFVWTPCAGPFLAAVLVQVIRQETDVQGFLVVLSFAVGAGVPMLLIALTGRQAISKLGFFTRHAESVRKTFGVLMLAAVALIASGYDPQSLFGPPAARTQTAIAVNGTTLVDGLANPYPAPGFTGNDAWLNSKPLTMSGLKGKVVLIDFWTYSCINCVRTLPYLTAWDAKYRDKGLVIVGVHSPEFEFEKKKENVEAAIAKFKIKYPVAMDSKLDTWTAYKNQYWPAHYLINREGQVVYTHFGEGNYAETENNIRFLLGLKGGETTTTDHVPYSANQTPETYLGKARAVNFKSPELFQPGTATFTFPEALAQNQWALSGRWKVDEEFSASAAPGAALRLHFNAKKVFLVLAKSGPKPVSATVTLNGQPLGAAAGADGRDGKIKVDDNRLYELISQDDVKPGIIDIRADDAGLEAYAFTFGS